MSGSVGEQKQRQKMEFGIIKKTLSVEPRAS